MFKKQTNFLTSIFLLFLSGLMSDACYLSGQSTKNPPDFVKVAAVQLNGYDKSLLPDFKIDAVGKAVQYIERAARDSAQLVVFPEYYLGPISIPGKETGAISEAAARNNIYVVIGSWEIFNDSSFANAALLFGRDGKLIGKYYKTHAAVDTYEGEPAYSSPPKGHDRNWFLRNDPEWIMKKGQEFPVFDLDFAKVGILTCYDGWFPEPFRILSLKGAEILIWVNNRNGKIEDYIVLAAMHHNTVSMICTNKADGGGAMIADYPKEIKASCPKGSENYISATINLKRLRYEREHDRNAQQRRPDIYGEILMDIPGKK
jgi:predicted amidohydrolase